MPKAKITLNDNSKILWKTNLHSCTDPSTGNNFKHESHKHSNVDHLKIVSPICLCSHPYSILNSLQPDNISGCMCKINVLMWQKNVFYSLLRVCCIFCFFSLSVLPHLNWYYYSMCSAVSCFVRTIFDINPCKRISSNLQLHWSGKSSSQPPPS